MNKLIGTLAMLCVVAMPAYGQNNAGDNSNSRHFPIKSEPARAHSKATTLGDAVREAGHEIKGASHEARRAIFTLCADGRHTIKGRAGCDGHGGVSPTN